MKTLSHSLTKIFRFQLYQNNNFSRIYGYSCNCDQVHNSFSLHNSGSLHSFSFFLLQQFVFVKGCCSSHINKHRTSPDNTRHTVFILLKLYQTDKLQLHAATIYYLSSISSHCSIHAKTSVVGSIQLGIRCVLR